ncbi:SGNH/GDSL hydrolase family protein [Mycobacterium sherrisii]|uniref:Hydrolase n=1 Tax=Mycobacterium sherrisii TaxID=243061 RepID=A0A1E3SS14_9MYCO|nr:SGNH/GDSL hydrolase family protein [Mycobacterium sherrisii]ODR04899.1 hydrolase [Mycobacterium sherrisii]ORW78285.1 hydrolase [Mycobacterium sherrisii]
MSEPTGPAGKTPKRYVALGSSMAAGPGIRPQAKDAPRWSGRSARNYPHLVADRMNFELVDVTFSGATTAHILTEPQHHAPPQITALDGSEAVVTVTIGGNDVGYVPLLMAAALPRPARWLPVVGGRIAQLLDREARDQALADAFDSLCAVGKAVCDRAPRARVFFVDYLTMLPPAGMAAPPLSDADADVGRHVAGELANLTARAAAATGCEVVGAAAASRDHHAWSAEPWTTTPAKFVVPLPGKPAPLHPNAAGMRAVADLVVAQLEKLGV